MNQPKPPRLVVLALLGLLAVFYGLGLTRVAGLVHDDVIYLVTAKALALGEGYRIISMPGEPWQIAYPPVYPALLAVVWKLWPEFPANVYAFKALNLPILLACLVLTYQLVTRVYGASRRHGWVVVTLLALSMPFITFADLTMSEPLYLLALLVALRFLEPLVERLEREETPLAPTALVMGFFCALPVLVRQVGLGLPAAVLFYLLLKRRFRLMVGTAAATALFMLPWQGWIFYLRRSGAPLSWDYLGWVDENTAGFQLGQFVRNFFENAWTAIARSVPEVVAPILKHEVVVGLASRFGLTGALAALSALVVVVVAAGYVLTARRRLRLYHLYIPMYLGLVFLIPWDPTRYVTTVAPFLLLMFVEAALAPVAALDPRGAWRRLAQVAAVGLIALSLASGAGRIASLARHGHFNDALLPPALAAKQADQAAMAEWARKTLPPDALWLHERDPLIYLLTDRQAISYMDGADPRPASVALFERYPTYLVTFEGAEFKTTHKALIARHPDKVERVYTAPHGTLAVYRVARRWP